MLPSARRQLGLLKSQGKLIPRESRLNLASGLVLSKLCYIMPIWGSAPAAHRRKAQVVVNAAARWAMGMPRKTKISNIMERAGWLSVVEQIRMTTLIQTWKTVHLRIPERIVDRMRITDNLLIEVDNPRLQFSKECMRWRSASEWNRLTDELRHTQTIAAFKRNIKRLIMSERIVEPD